MSIEKPQIPKNVPENAQWLTGVGAGSWFSLIMENNAYRIQRFSPEGEVECSRLFTTEGDFDMNKKYQFTYISHCKECTIIQNEITYKFYTNEY